MHPPRRRRRFWFLQFSLRSLLAATTLAAVACAWYLQPPSREELLAGGQLKLWRQVKLVPAPALALPAGLGSVPPNTPPPEPTIVNHGRWVLSDAVGGVISLASARVLAASLYEVTPLDPATLIGVAALLVLTSLLAAYLPARRASRVDPSIVLKSD